jgi:hypothetical protein
MLFATNLGVRDSRSFIHLDYIRRLPSGFTSLCEDGETILDKICVMIDDNVTTNADIVVKQ